MSVAGIVYINLNNISRRLLSAPEETITNNRPTRYLPSGVHESISTRFPRKRTIRPIETTARILSSGGRRAGRDVYSRQVAACVLLRWKYSSQLWTTWDTGHGVSSLHLRFVRCNAAVSVSSSSPVSPSLAPLRIDEDLYTRDGKRREDRGGGGEQFTAGT